MSAGFDTTEKYKVFRGLHATVGSASFIMFDAAGQAAWYHVDPTERDLNTLQRNADRLMQSASCFGPHPFCRELCVAMPMWMDRRSWKTAKRLKGLVRLSR